jgi:uncharacterized damage-inducible protein DinB
MMLVVSASKLKDDFLPRLRAAVAHLSDDEVWKRSGDASNAVGNILLHMAGNLRQWIVAGLGGRDDVRDRAKEFSARSGLTGAALMSTVAETVEEAVAVIRLTDPSDLLRTRTVQGYDVTGFEVLYHAVEHFSYHLGQVAVIVKERKNVDLAFYDRRGRMTL